MRRTLVPILALCCCVGVLSLGGCGGQDLSRAFGLTRDAPDEFTVTTRAPLSMPPDYALRPPVPGASRPQEVSSQQAAEEALAPQIALQGTGGKDSPGQDALLQQAGPAAPRDIRARLASEASLDQPSQNFTDRLMFWRPPVQPGTIVDARKESQRLRQNAALGEASSTGDTPVITPKRGNGFLDTLF